MLLLEEKRSSIITQAVTKGLNLAVRMKDSDIDWIGDIPEYWDLRKKSVISRVVRGQKGIVILETTQHCAMDNRCRSDKGLIWN